MLMAQLRYLEMIYHPRSSTLYFGFSCLIRFCSSNNASVSVLVVRNIMLEVSFDHSADPGGMALRARIAGHTNF